MGMFFVYLTLFFINLISSTDLESQAPANSSAGAQDDVQTGGQDVENPANSSAGAQDDVQTGGQDENEDNLADFKDDPANSSAGAQDVENPANSSAGAQDEVQA